MPAHNAGYPLSNGKPLRNCYNFTLFLPLLFYFYFWVMVNLSTIVTLFIKVIPFVVGNLELNDGKILTTMEW